MVSQGTAHVTVKSKGKPADNPTVNFERAVADDLEDDVNFEFETKPSSSTVLEYSILKWIQPHLAYPRICEHGNELGIPIFADPDKTDGASRKRLGTLFVEDPLETEQLRESSGLWSGSTASGSPLWIWDACLDLLEYIRTKPSNMLLTIPMTAVDQESPDVTRAYFRINVLLQSWVRVAQEFEVMPAFSWLLLSECFRLPVWGGVRNREPSTPAFCFSIRWYEIFGTINGQPRADFHPDFNLANPFNNGKGTPLHAICETASFHWTSLEGKNIWFAVTSCDVRRLNVASERSPDWNSMVIKRICKMSLRGWQRMLNKFHDDIKKCSIDVHEQQILGDASATSETSSRLLFDIREKLKRIVFDIESNISSLDALGHAYGVLRSLEETHGMRLLLRQTQSILKTALENANHLDARAKLIQDSLNQALALQGTSIGWHKLRLQYADSSTLKSGVSITMLFLPGIFVSTFFSSYVFFGTGDAATAYHLDSNALTGWLATVLPLTALTIILLAFFRTSWDWLYLLVQHYRVDRNYRKAHKMESGPKRYTERSTSTV